jgi:hypothetical protein
MVGKRLAGPASDIRRRERVKRVLSRTSRLPLYSSVSNSWVVTVQLTDKTTRCTRGRKYDCSTSLQICLAITNCHAYSARHDYTNRPRRLFSCCEAAGTSTEPVAVGNLSGWETKLHRPGVGPFFHNGGGGKPGREKGPQAAVGQTALSATAIAGGVIGGSGKLLGHSRGVDSRPLLPLTLPTVTPSALAF